MECLEGDSYAAIKQKLTEEEQQTIDCEETNDQYVWVHGLFEKVWKEMEVQNQMKNIIPETVQTAQGAMSYIYAATGNKFIVIIDEWDVLIRDEAGKVHECVIQNYFK